MVIQSLEKTYEVVRQLESDIFVSHYLCKEQGEEEHLRIVVEIRADDVTKPVIWQLTECSDNPAFTDFCETFSYDGNVYGVFSYGEGILLKEGLTSGIWNVPIRYELGRAILEKVIVQNIPLHMAERLLSTERIVVSEEEQNPMFLYGFQNWDHAQEPNTAFDLIRNLFLPESDNGLYPELEEFYKLKGQEMYDDQMELYKAYLLLMPAFSEERIPVEKEKVTIGEHLKKHGGKIAKSVKFLLGVLAMALALAVLVGLWTEKIFPLIESAYLVKTIDAGSEKLEGYHGRVMIKNPQTGKTLKKGMLEEGKLSGYGEEYHQSGILCYEGEFSGGEYGGYGTLYDSNGKLLYKGEFSEGLYDGNGILYGSRGNIVYQGTFVRGRKEGTGSLYDSEENLIYEGGLKADRFEGEGVRFKHGQVIEKGTYEGGLLVAGNGFFYDEDGVVCYEGSVADGMKQGEGIAYEKGKMVYEGSFSRNRYEGIGKQYSAETGDLLYEGEFVRGIYSGEGTLYEPGTGYIRYQGTFRKGYYDGEGLEYDASGNLMYEGNFRLGVYNGPGVFYDTNTGIPVLEGIFRNGMLVTSAEALKALEEMETESLAENMTDTAEEDIAETDIASITDITGETEASEVEGSGESERAVERGPGITVPNVEEGTLEETENASEGGAEHEGEESSVVAAEKG